MVLGPAASAPPKLEMQILSPIPKPTESRLCGYLSNHVPGALPAILLLATVLALALAPHLNLNKVWLPLWPPSAPQ